MTVDTHILDERFVLHPGGAVWWPGQDLLMLADLHLGKVTHFRKNGSAVPLEAIEENYRRLERLITFFDPAGLIFLGDLFHSNLNREWDRFKAWVQEKGLQLTLVEGNHDIISPHRYEELGIVVLPQKRIGRFLLTHYPVLEEGYFNFCGHIHPGIRMRGKGRQSLKLPCFYKTPSQMILPAFGTFTGKHLLSPGPNDQVFVIAGDEVISII